MPPAPDLGSVRYLFDEDSLGFGIWLSRLRTDKACVGKHPVNELLPLGTPDPDWIPVAAEHGWIVITKNSKIRTHPVEAQLAIAHGLRVACLIEPMRDAPRWEFARMVLRHWDAIANLDSQTKATWLAVYRDRTQIRDFQPGKPERARKGEL